MKCQVCGKEVNKLYGVDDDHHIPYTSEYFEDLTELFIQKQVCGNCCHGAKIVLWTPEVGWENIYA
jgi:hypothetical protein